MSGIGDIAARRLHRKVYVSEVPKNADASGTFDADLAGNIGLKPFPPGLPRDRYRLYRVLGFAREDLNCESLRLILSGLPPVDEGFQCNGHTVVSISLRLSDIIPLVDLGHSDISVQDLVDDPLGDYEPAGYRAQLAVNNRSFVDLHFIWRGDTHQEPQQDFVPHGTTMERKSKNIDYDAKAKYYIEFFQNNAGHPGHRIGDATIKVRGRKDIDLVITNVNGGGKELWYIDWTGAAILIGSLLLGGGSLQSELQDSPTATAT